MSAGLAASTDTPGSTPPETSRTVPAMPLACWALACPDRTEVRRHTVAANNTTIRRIRAPYACGRSAVRGFGGSWFASRRAMTNLRTSEPQTTDLFLGLRRPCGAQHVLQTEIAFVARVLVDEPVDAVPRQLRGPWPRPRVWVGNRELVIDGAI